MYKTVGTDTQRGDLIKFITKIREDTDRWTGTDTQTDSKVFS
jgi:hypothetical protein